MFNGTLSGVITSDIKSRMDKSGNPVCNFDVAENRKIQGMSKTITEFITVAAFGPTAEACIKYLKKGRKVVVKVSHIQAKAYIGRDRQPHAKIHAYADDVEFGDQAEFTMNLSEEPLVEPREQTPYLDSMPEMPDGFITVESADLPF